MFQISLVFIGLFAGSFELMFRASIGTATANCSKKAYQTFDTSKIQYPSVIEPCTKILPPQAELNTIATYSYIPEYPVLLLTINQCTLFAYIRRARVYRKTQSSITDWKKYNRVTNLSFYNRS